MNSTTKRKPAKTVSNAASLVIHRTKNGKSEILMGRRGNKARFKPGVYVFPGGMVEPADGKAKPKKRLNAKHKRYMAVGMSNYGANMLAMTAVREAYEEVGLILGSKGDVGQVNQKSWQAFKTMGLSPDLSKLDYLGRAITPSFQPIRFHARFFSVPFEDLEGKIAGDGVLEDVRWINVNKYNDFEMMKVQHMIIETLKEKLRTGKTKPKKLFFKWNKINILPE
ncbi:MAG: NUDIX hydrolase [Pseudomonadota bacterium]|nr:NUDIX hydrolase [Pseudomonadota bacterium]